MSIASDLNAKMKKNNYLINIVESDDLIAAWCFEKKNKFKRSFNLSRVPTEYRYSAPPSEKALLMPCRVSHKSAGVMSSDQLLKACHTRTGLLEPEQVINYGSTLACHHSSAPNMRSVTSISQLEAVDFAKRNIAPYISPIMDGVTLTRVVNDLGWKGKVTAKIIKGRQYIIFGGYAGLRSIFPGTIYSARNARVVQMAIGALGIRTLVKEGIKLTVRITVPLVIAECILKDQFTLANVIGRTAADLIKIAIGSIVGGLFGLGTGTLFAAATAPIVVTIVVSLMAGYAIEKIDEHYGLTDKLVSLLEQGGRALAEKKDEMEKKMGRALNEVEKEFCWRAYGVDITKPLSMQR